MTVGTIDNPVKAGVPKDSQWAPPRERDPTAQAVLNALPKPDFFICFYYKRDDPKKVHLLVHGAAKMGTLYQIHDMIDDIIVENERRVERAQKEQGKVV